MEKRTKFIIESNQLELTFNSSAYIKRTENTELVADLSFYFWTSWS